MQLVFTFSTQAQSFDSLLTAKTKNIDQYIQDEMQKRDIPGLVYGICHKNKLVRVKAFGLADIQNRGLVTDSTVFELASITKQFTAVAIMLLVQEGKINLSDPIKLYLKECPVLWEKITVRQLL